MRTRQTRQDHASAPQLDLFEGPSAPKDSTRRRSFRAPAETSRFLNGKQADNVVNMADWRPFSNWAYSEPFG